MAELTESSYVVLTTGSYDVMVEVVCRDLEHYTELLYDRLQLIDGVVATETFFVLEAHKLAYGLGRGYAGGPEPTPHGDQARRRVLITG